MAGFVVTKHNVRQIANNNGNGNTEALRSRSGAEFQQKAFNVATTGCLCVEAVVVGMRLRQAGFKVTHYRTNRRYGTTIRLVGDVAPKRASRESE